MDLQKIKLKNFLRPLLKINGYGYGSGYGDGYGDGDGYGYGSGYGYGYGDGDGYGYGNGSGYGYGDGNGNGYGNGNGNGNGNGLKSINNNTVYLIDGIQTIICKINGDVARGFMLEKDLSLLPCFIVRNDYFFSHGKNLKEAIKSLEEKTNLKLPIEKRIINFRNKFKNYNIKRSASLFYDWHFKLTGSCKMGRDNFCQQNGIDLKRSKISVHEFIKLTENSYGGEIIKKLK